MKKYIYLAVLTVLLNSCLSIASFDDFPRDSDKIDFKKYSKEFEEKSEPFWTTSTSNEYYFEIDLELDDQKLELLIKQVMRNDGYRIKISDLQKKFIIGKRGMRMNEWNSIIGVYYHQKENVPGKKMSNSSMIKKRKIQIYVRCEITQDITGGWSENRAKDLALDLKEVMENI